METVKKKKKPVMSSGMKIVKPKKSK